MHDLMAPPRLGMFLHVSEVPLPTSLSGFGVSTLNFPGLLSLLELHAGLPAPAHSDEERVIEYLQALQEADDPFLQASFAVDAFAVATRILSLRDALYLHGWDGTSCGGEGLLAAIGRVESVAQHRVSAGEAQRLDALAAALSKGVQLPLEGIVLYQPLLSLPLRWRELLSLLPVQEAVTSPMGAPGTRLAAVQQILSDWSSTPSARLEGLTDDGSIEVWQASTRPTAARFIVDRLAQLGAGDLAVIPEGHGLLQATLSLAGLPEHGMSEYSPFRPELQVLSLAMSLLWQPLDLSALLQFLSHPVSPLPSGLRYRLARVVAQKPGIGSPLWQEVVKEALEQAGEWTPHWQEAIETWLTPACHDPSAGIPVSMLLTRTQQVMGWLQGRMVDRNGKIRPLVKVAFDQAAKFASSLEAMGDVWVLPRLLQQLLAQANALGSRNPEVRQEVGSRDWLARDAAAVCAADTVLWGPLQRSTNIPDRPWSEQELKQLSRIGVDWPKPTAQVERQMQESLRPLLCARDKLVLLLPPPGEELHPVWPMLEALLPELAVHSVEAAALAGDLPTVHPKTLRPLPSTSRWWHLPASVRLPNREMESYSSLDLLLKAPQQWVLRYSARLSRARLLSLPDLSTLYGSLSHRLFEELFRMHGLTALDWTVESLAQWAEPTLARLIEQEGAILLQPGKRQALLHLRASLLRALPELLHQLRASELTLLEAERQLQGTFEGGALQGRADLVVATKQGGNAMLDFKWHGKRHAERLRSNQALQPVLYAELFRQETGHWAEPAYFLVRDAQLFAQNRNVFRLAREISPNNDETGPQVWQRFLVSWRWRQAQLASGDIEVVCEGSNGAEDAAEAPQDGLAHSEVSDRYNDTRYLTGWSRYA